MEIKRLKVSYECHQCGYTTEVVEKEHSDCQMKQIEHVRSVDGPVCGGFCHPVHIEEVA